MGESQNEATGAAGETTQNATKTDDPQSKENVFDNRQSHKKLVRVVTVMAYLFSVSFVAIALSGYYVFIWRPPNRGSTSRARTMSQVQAQYFAGISAAESPIINNNNNTTVEHNTMIIFKNEISQRGGINISSNVSLQSNEMILNSTSASVNPISTQMYQNKTDKVTTDMRSDIYGISNGRTDLPGERGNLETSTLFMKMSSEKGSMTTTDFPFSTNLFIENKLTNLSNSSDSVGAEDIDENKVLNHNGTSSSGQQKSDTANETVTTAATMNLVGILPTGSIRSSTQGYHDEKITKISSQDDAGLSAKLRDIYPPLPIHLKDRQTHSDQTKKDTFSVLSTIAPPNINVEQLELNNSEGNKLNQYNLPKR